MVMPLAISLLLDTLDSQRARSYPLEHPKNILLSRPGLSWFESALLSSTFPDVAQTGAWSCSSTRTGGHGLLAGLDSVVRRALGQRATTTSRGSRSVLDRFAADGGKR
jgi:hypothetical protein